MLEKNTSNRFAEVGASDGTTQNAKEGETYVSVSDSHAHIKLLYLIPELFQ